jgi:murein DD-endopeptidase MepM/ murein hydrolase activator NlpD
LYDIARGHGLTVGELIAWNGLDGTLIRPGQVLSLTRDAGAPPAAPLVVHVQPGDSLWSIARAHGSTVDALATANGLSDGVDPQGGPGAHGARPLRRRRRDHRRAYHQRRRPAPTQVRVMPGDNLWKIARQHNTTIAAIMSLNGLTSDRLTVGEVLRVVPGPDLGVASSVSGSAAFVPDGSDAMVWPLVGQITSRFGWRRLSIGGSNMHNGLDIGGRTGDPIRSATSGVVAYSGWRGGFGNLVVVENGDTEYWYAPRLALIASVGDRVAPGEVIARVGATGISTGPHLHFEIRVDGTPIDPLPILEARAER